jgi:hypothetical protein
MVRCQRICSVPSKTKPWGSLHSEKSKEKPETPDCLWRRRDWTNSSKAIVPSMRNNHRHQRTICAYSTMPFELVASNPLLVGCQPCLPIKQNFCKIGQHCTTGLRTLQLQCVRLSRVTLQMCMPGTTTTSSLGDSCELLHTELPLASWTSRHSCAALNRRTHTRYASSRCRCWCRIGISLNLHQKSWTGQNNCRQQLTNQPPN